MTLRSGNLDAHKKKQTNEEKNVYVDTNCNPIIPHYFEIDLKHLSCKFNLKAGTAERGN